MWQLCQYASAEYHLPVYTSDNEGPPCLNHRQLSAHLPLDLTGVNTLLGVLAFSGVGALAQLVSCWGWLPAPALPATRVSLRTKLALPCTDLPSILLLVSRVTQGALGLLLPAAEAGVACTSAAAAASAGGDGNASGWLLAVATAGSWTDLQLASRLRLRSPLLPVQSEFAAASCSGQQQ